MTSSHASLIDPRLQNRRRDRPAGRIIREPPCRDSQRPQSAPPHKISFSIRSPVRPARLTPLGTRQTGSGPYGGAQPSRAACFEKMGPASSSNHLRRWAPFCRWSFHLQICCTPRISLLVSYPSPTETHQRPRTCASAASSRKASSIISLRSASGRIASRGHGRRGRRDRSRPFPDQWNAVGPLIWVQSGLVRANACR
jgi:hypothetical protein